MGKSARSFIFFVFLIAVLGFFTNDWGSFFYGATVGVVNVGLHYGIFMVQKKRVSYYPSQVVVITISSLVARFFSVGCLLVFGMRHPLLESVHMLLGFVLGQLFFFIHQLLVIKNNGK